MKINKMCASRLMTVFFAGLLAVLCYIVSAQEAAAQAYRAQIGGPNGRIFPDSAFRGIFMVEKYPMVQLNDKRERLAPGARVMDSMNRIVPPAKLTGKRYAVNYVRSADGRLNTVWLLTKQEAQVRRKVENPGWWKRAKETFYDWATMLGGLGALL